jgi:hypothetical protein
MSQTFVVKLSDVLIKALKKEEQVNNFGGDDLEYFLSQRLDMYLTDYFVGSEDVKVMEI